MKAKAPEPIKQVKRTVTSNNPKNAIRKLHSAEPDKLRIPLNLIEDKEIEEKPKPVHVNAYLHKKDPIHQKNESPAGTGKKRASKLIGDIKKKMKDKSQSKTSSGLTDEYTGITLDTRASEDASYNPASTAHETNAEEKEDDHHEEKDYDHQEEEDKTGEFNNSSNNSKGSSNRSANLLEFEEDGDEKDIDLAFNFADDNFDDEDFEVGSTPHSRAIMEEIREEEELGDDDAFEKRQIRNRIREIENEIGQRWETISKYCDKETAMK